MKPGSSASPSALPIEAARRDDEPALVGLLAAAELPASDLADHLGSFLVLRDGEGLAGAVGLELHGPDALLRSLVVRPERRQAGVGRALLREAVALARRSGVERLYLLTTTAAPFFERHGFGRTARNGVPAAIAASTQFQGLCPATAICLAARVEEVRA